MGRIVVTEFVSVDGVIEDPGGSEDFKYGGWSFEYERGEEGNKFKLDEALEDELRLMVFPVVLGAGRRLFSETSDKKRLRLTDSRTVGDGVEILIYEPA